MSIVSNWRERGGRLRLEVNNNGYGITLGKSRRIDISQFNQEFLDKLNGEPDLSIEIKVREVEEMPVAA